MKATTWFVNFYLPFIRTLFIESAPTKVGETDTRQPPYATSACQSVEPVSRKRTCKVGLGRFIPEYCWSKIRLVAARKLTTSTPITNCVLLVQRELRIDLAHDATVGERCRKQKFSYGFTKIHLWVHLATSDWIASTYLCRSRAEAFKERGWGRRTRRDPNHRRS